MAALEVTTDVTKLEFNTKLKERIVITNDDTRRVGFKMRLSRVPSAALYMVTPRIGTIVAGGSAKIDVRVNVDKVPEDMEGPNIISVETKELSASEEAAYNTCMQGDMAAALKELNIPDDGTVDTEKTLLDWIMKHSRAKPTTLRLECLISKSLLTKQREATTPQPKPEVAPTPLTVQNDAALADEIEFISKENSRLQADINALKQKRQELYFANKAHQAAAEELKSKSEQTGVTVPVGVFLALWLAVCYVGLVLDNYYS